MSQILKLLGHIFSLHIPYLQESCKRVSTWFNSPSGIIFGEKKSENDLSNIFLQNKKNA